MARRRSGPRSLRRRVEIRAHFRCEYCHAPQSVCGYPLHIDHVIPVARGGSNAFLNRALCCSVCNLAKADQLIAWDPLTRTEVPLFNPRTDEWADHFEWGADRRTVKGRTPIGRATVEALDMNNRIRLTARLLWFANGFLP